MKVSLGWQSRDGREEGCPDGGRCWHGCGEFTCFRVMFCAPLSAANYPGDLWPRDVAEAEMRRGSADDYRL